MDEREVYLYKITNPVGGVYIGQTVDPRKRFMVYARSAMPFQKRLKASVDKYGWASHSAEVITSIPQSQADYAEKYLIAYYSSTNRSGLNILSGGQIRLTEDHYKKHSLIMTGRKQTPDQIAKRAKSMVGNKNAKGSIRNQAFKDNIRLKMTGIKRDPACYRKPKPSLQKPVLCFDLTGKFVKEYSKAYDTLVDGFNPSCVNKMCLNSEGRKQHKGMVFKYKTNG